MNKTDHGFERELLAGLSRLADEAPAGPSPKSIVRRLRRRTLFRRWTGAGIAAAVLIAACATVWIVIASPRDLNSSMGSAAREELQPKTLAQSPQPLPVNAEPKQIEAALRRCFASNEVKGNILVIKTHDEELSFCVSNGGISTKKLHARLTRMLSQFESATIYMHNGQLSYTLVSEQTL